MKQSSSKKFGHFNLQSTEECWREGWLAGFIKMPGI